MTNHPNGTLYIGVTADLPRRIWEHRQGMGSKLAKRYHLKRLVCAEPHEDITAAIQRETSMKRWPREWKVSLIAAANPEWNDLYDQLV